jgi:ABC-type glycerol-3-phosphate transport system substrate-binding protein
MSTQKTILRSLLLLVCTYGIVMMNSCTKATNETIQLWHFWSEPKQESTFLELIHQFEIENPGIKIVCTPLQWAEGKQKLLMGLSSDAPPDVVQIGFEWVKEFAPALEGINSSILSDVHPELRKAVNINKEFVALPWTMNSRALFVQNDFVKENFITRNDTILTLTRVVEKLNQYADSKSYYALGLPSYEPHNVLKKTIPFLREYGSKFMMDTLYSSTIDSASIRGLNLLIQLSKKSIIESSSKLDERFKRGEIAAIISGMWLLQDTIQSSKWSILPCLRGNILSADCFAISKKSTKKSIANKLIEFLAKPKTSVQYSMKIPDAGFSAMVQTDSSYLRFIRSSQLREAMYQQVKRSIPLVSSSKFLIAEQIIEQSLMPAMYGKLSADSTLSSIKKKLYSEGI